GLLPVRQGKKIGYINKHGKVVIPLIYDSLGGSEWARGALGGRIVVKKNGAFGMIDTNNRTIIAFDKSIRHLGDVSKGSAAITRAGKQYRIDINGNPLSTTTQTTTDDTTATSSRPIRDSDFFPRQQEGRWGFVDSEGTPMIVFAFDEVRPYSEGLAAVRQGEFWGFINHAGQLVIEFRFDNAGIIADSTDSPHLPTPFVFSQGKAWIGNLNNGDKLCINAQGVNVNCHNP
ncbi:MAG: WG repeat-containing protein, partial [Moraxella sp.]|nr:WG repeat-containing protein [Moraxella sp.]